MSAFSFIKTKFSYELKRLTALAQYRFHKDALVATLSQTMPNVAIELTNICNANCTFCAYQFQTRPTGIMNENVYRKVIDNFIECGGGHIHLVPTVGDSFVDPDLINRIRYARENSEITSVGIISNMISLGHHGAAALVESGLTELTVSMSGMDEKMYQRVYRSKQYRRVIKNIRDFATANNDAGRPVAFRLNLRADRSIKEIYDYPDHKEIEALVGSENIYTSLFYDNWAGKITQDMLTGTMKLRTGTNFFRPRISPCSELFSGPMVAWDGRVTACGCRDVDISELVIGDVNVDHLGEIWFGEQIEKLREEFLTDKIAPICDTCTHYSNLSHYLLDGSERYLNMDPSPWLNRAD